MIVGEIKKDGAIKMLLGAQKREFTVEKTGTGKYLIRHNLGTPNYFLGLTPTGSVPALFATVESDENSCLVVSDMGGAPADTDFSFSLMWDGDEDMYVLGEKSDFTAFVDYKGEMMRFDFPHHLKEFLNKIC